MDQKCKIAELQDGTIKTLFALERLGKDQDTIVLIELTEKMPVDLLLRLSQILIRLLLRDGKELMLTITNHTPSILKTIWKPISHGVREIRMEILPMEILELTVLIHMPLMVFMPKDPRLLPKLFPILIQSLLRDGKVLMLTTTNHTLPTLKTTLKPTSLCARETKMEKLPMETLELTVLTHMLPTVFMLKFMEKKTHLREKNQHPSEMLNLIENSLPVMDLKEKGPVSIVENLQLSRLQSHWPWLNLLSHYATVLMVVPVISVKLQHKEKKEEKLPNHLFRSRKATTSPLALIETQLIANPHALNL